MNQGSSRPSPPLEIFLFFTQPIAKGGRCWIWLCEAQSFLTGIFLLFVYLEAELSLRAMRPTSSDAKLMGGGWT